jgi:WD40-like Beta Propeller Repeat
MIVLVLLLTLVVGALLSGQKGLVQADTKAVADMIAAELSAARQQAITEGQPVAFAIPSENGAKPHSQGYGIIEGYTPSLASVKSFAAEHPNTCVAVGVIGPGSTIGKPELALVGQSFDLVPWLVASGADKDYVFCFLPDGSLVTNDLPLYSGGYNILVSSGLSYSSSSPPPGTGWGMAPSYFQLNEGASLRTISVSPLGEVSVGRDAAGVSMVDRLDFQEVPAAVPSLPGVTASTPVLLDIEVFPIPDVANLPPGIEALVDVKGHLTLQVTATDSDPERRLYCDWSSDRGGPFSRPDQHPMEWEQDAVGPGVGAWVSRVEWRPPPGANGGELFELSAEVTDPSGTSDTDRIGATGLVQTVHRSKILFQSQRATGNGLYTMLPDGSDVTFLFSGRNGVLSPAGDQVFYARGDTLYLRPLGGDNEIALLTMPAEPFQDHFGNWQPGQVKPNCINQKGDLLFWTTGNSTYVAEFNGFSPVVPYRLNGDPGFVDAYGDRHVDLFISSGGGHVAYDDGYHLYLADFDENGPPYITGGNRNLTDSFLGGTPAGNPSWSPDGRSLFFHADNSGSLDIGLFDFDPSTGVPSNPRYLTNDPAEDGMMSMSPDGSQYVYNKVQGGDWDIVRVNADGSNFVNLTADNPNDDLLPVWGR